MKTAVVLLLALSGVASQNGDSPEIDH